MRPAGTRGYSDLSKRRKIVKLEKIEVPVADIHDLIRMKEAAGREVDLLHIPILRKLAEGSS